VKPSLLPLLACPECHGDLALRADAQARNGTEVLEGALNCGRCGRTFPILRGVPRLLPDLITVEKERTAKRFGWQWRYFVELHDEHRDQFLDWIAPLDDRYFEGKSILDAGCGIGRHVRWAAAFGGSAIIGMDLGEAVDTAQQNVGHLDNVHIIQGDITKPPFRSGPRDAPFDFVYSIGVLHHLPDPEAGFDSLLKVVRPGGTIFAWVYGYENNAYVRRLIDPARRWVTRWLPARLLVVFTWPLALVLRFLVRWIYAPSQGTRIGRRLPASAYLASLAPFSFRQMWVIVYDHLTAPIAFYIRRPEFESWFTSRGLDDVSISWRNQNSWRGRATKPQLGTMSESRMAGDAEPRAGSGETRL
jgi:SAM-dependent methyltransferase